MANPADKRSGQDRRKLDMYAHLDDVMLSQMRPNRRAHHRRLGIPYRLVRKDILPVEEIRVEQVLTSPAEKLRAIS